MEPGRAQTVCDHAHAEKRDLSDEGTHPPSPRRKPGDDAPVGAQVSTGTPPAATPLRPGVTGRVLLGVIRAYQLTLSSLIGRTCRHLPTCSEYAAEAIRRHGAWAGCWLGLFRVARCHPWGSEGFDPVPERIPAHGWRVWRYRRRGAG